MSGQLFRIYVANPTNQIHDFAYRFNHSNGKTQLMSVKIPSGTQVCLPGPGFSKDQVEEITTHHLRSGAVMIDDVADSKAYSSLVFSVDKSVPGSTIMLAAETNHGELTDRGQRTRQEAAVAVNDTLENKVGNVDRTHVDIHEERPGTGPVHDPLADSVVVTRDPSENAETVRVPVKQRRGR
jgi:hypothetical protein